MTHTVGNMLGRGVYLVFCHLLLMKTLILSLRVISLVSFWSVLTLQIILFMER